MYSLRLLYGASGHSPPMEVVHTLRYLTQFLTFHFWQVIEAYVRLWSFWAAGFVLSYKWLGTSSKGSLKSVSLAKSLTWLATPSQQISSTVIKRCQAHIGISSGISRYVVHSTLLAEEILAATSPNPGLHCPHYPRRYFYSKHFTAFNSSISPVQSASSKDIHSFYVPEFRVSTSVRKLVTWP